MLVNRFIGCKSLTDAKNVIANNNIAFASLSAEELAKINELFKFVIPDDEITIKNSFDYERVFKAIKEDTNMLNVSKHSEIKTNLTLATQELFGKLEAAKKAVKVEAGQTCEEYVNKVDNSLNIVKGAFGSALDFLDKQLGYTVLKQNILNVLESGKDVQNPEKWGIMAKECRSQVEAYIAKIEILGNPDKAEKLKELIGTLEGEDIFTKFFSTIKWITRKVTRKLRKWFRMDDEKSVVGAVARSIAGFAGLLRAGLQIVWSAAGFVTSFVVAGAIQIASWIVNAIKDLVAKVKDWHSKKNEPVPLELEDDDEE